METNNNPPGTPQPPTQPPHHNISQDQINNQEKQAFVQKLKYFIHLFYTKLPDSIQYIRDNRGFVLNYRAFQDQQAHMTVQEIFKCSFDSFLRLAKRHGFEVKQKFKEAEKLNFVIFKNKQILLRQQEQIQSDSRYEEWSELQHESELDDYPQPKQLEMILKIKEKQHKPQFISNTIIEKQQNMDSFEMRKFNEASIEIKLQENANHFNLFQLSSTNLNQTTLMERARIQKENYTRCSRIIDNTIALLLQANRMNKIEEKKQFLLNNITEVYDMLSDSMNNINVLKSLLNSKDEKEQIKANNIQL